ncbi:hypothetical protein [Halobacterium litoreum]|uniref:Uncharacterized protein n=1 Tax=Halobacterium litoreum TaxID=2039234 RepID=A0ABD5NEF2_9EURY|nr:hypothetical protein [Halobacterium litoreum]UHH13587.1 hypothetical protein LT972_00995 [Halobacterium litoreum]
MATCEENPAETLSSLGMLERLRFEVADEQFEGYSHRKRVEDDRLWVVVRTREDRVFRIETQWANGWLAPLVDEYDGGEDSVEPVGTLSSVEALGYASGGA